MVGSSIELVDLIERAERAVAHIHRHPGASTCEIARAIGASETETYVALYRTGRHHAVGLTVTDGWQPASNCSEIAERLADPMLAPCPSPTPAELPTR